MKKYIAFSSALIALVAFNSCSEDFSDEVSDDIANQTTGSADFTTYVALGNSLTSGYSNSALYVEGQENAYPVRMAERFAQVTPNMTAFKLPLMKDNLGGYTIGGTLMGTNRLVLTQTGTSLSSLSPAVMEGTPTTEITKGIAGLYGNMGVPGAKSFHLGLDAYGSAANLSTGKANPYFVYFASSATTSVLKDALAQKPTFFSLWIGNNDVLAYATSGGDEGGKDQTGNINPATYGYNDITDPNVLAASIKGITDALTAQGAKGVVGNIPYVTTIPYFTTVPYNALPLTAEQATALNAGYAAYNGALTTMVTNKVITQAEADSRKITFAAGQNPVVIIDNALTDLTSINPALVSMRQIKQGELLTLTASSLIKAGSGSTKPLDGKYVLTSTEVTKVTNAVKKYNAAIAGIVAANSNLALADTNAEMTALAAAPNPLFKFDGIQYTSQYITGATFSLDGVHPTPKGAAILANVFLKAINAKFGSTLLPFNPNAYPGM